jgi:alpha-galactosidase
MGWRSWNCYHLDVSDKKIRAVVDAVSAKDRKVDGIATSLLDLGYDRVGVDDGWQACGAGYKESFHGKDGTPLVNKSIFPDLKDLVTYGHARKVKMGWYNNNCHCMDEGKLRSETVFGEEAYKKDIEMLIDAGFDGVKIDNCGDEDGSGFAGRVKYLKESGHVLMVENANQGDKRHQGPGGPHGPPRGDPVDQSWCPMNMFRTGGDIGASFHSAMQKLNRTRPYQDLKAPVSRPGCWAYPDMLEVGNIKSFVESRSHFGGWCVVSAPLILGLDVTNSKLVDSVWDIISNHEAIAINQAWAGHPGRLVYETSEDQSGQRGAYQVWAKRMPEGGQAALIINTGVSTVDVSIKLADLGLEGPCSMRDVWAHRDLGRATTLWEVTGLKKHDSAFVRFSPSSPAPPAPPVPPSPPPPSPPSPPSPVPTVCGTCRACFNPTNHKCQADGTHHPKTKAACEAKGHIWCGSSASEAYVI